MEIKGAKWEASRFQFDMKPLRCVRTWSPWLTQVFRAVQDTLSICPGPSHHLVVTDAPQAEPGAHISVSDAHDAQ